MSTTITRTAPLAIAIALALVVACHESGGSQADDPPECAPRCGKADGAAEDGRERLRLLPGGDWPAPLDVEAIEFPSDVLVEGMHAHLRTSPSLTAFEAAQVAMADELGNDALEIEDFGPESYTYVYVPVWGDVALPALVASAIDDDAPVASAHTRGAVTGDPVALLDVAAISRDPVAYAEVVRQVSVNPALPDSLRGRAWAYLHETSGRGGRYAGDATIRTLDDVHPVALPDAIAAMLQSGSARVRRNGLLGAAQFGLLSPAVVDAAIADPSFLVRMDAAAHFFEGTDVSEQRQGEFLAELDDPEFIARVRLEVIRSMGWSELSEGLFAASPGSMDVQLQVYRGAVVGEMLRTVPGDVPFEPLATLAPAFADVDPIALDLIEALRRSNVHTDEERFRFIAPLLDSGAPEAACTYAIELLHSEDSTADMAEDARPCFIAIENGNTPALKEAFEAAWPDMVGTVDERRGALRALMSTTGWTARAYIAAALLRVGALGDDEREAVVREFVGSYVWLRHRLLDAYVDGGGSAATVVELLQTHLGWAPGKPQPARSAELYHHAAELLLRTGVEGETLAETLSQILATEPGHAFPLWRVFLTATPEFRDDAPVTGLIWLLGHPSISDELLRDSIHRILVPGGAKVDSQVLNYFTEAEVDPKLLALANTVLRAGGSSKNASIYFRHVVPGTLRPDVDLDLTRLRIEAVRAAAAQQVDAIPDADEVDGWLGEDRLALSIPSATEALAVVTEIGARGLDDARETLEALTELTYAPDVQELSEADVLGVRELLTTGDWAGTNNPRTWEAKFGLMILDCQRGAGYDEMRDRYRDTIGMRWDLADAVRDELGESAALQTLLEKVGPDYDGAFVTSSLAEVCSVGAKLPEDRRIALVAEALAQHSNVNQTYNGDVLEAVLTHENLDPAPLRGAMLRRAYVMVSFFNGIDPQLARWVATETVPPEHALELLALAASLAKVDERPRQDFPSLVRAFVGREDLAAEQRTEALSLVAYVRG